MNAIDLLALEHGADEEVLEDMLRTKDLELNFNGRSVWGDIAKAIMSGRRDIAASRGLPQGHVTPVNLDIALYHPEEKAMYVAVDYLLSGRSSKRDPMMARAERRIACGGEPRTVELTEVSVGTTAKMLELLDVIDLARVIWLPLRG